MSEEPKTPRRGRIVAIVALVVVVALVAAGVWWVNDYYHADDVALAAVADEDGAADGVTVHSIDGGMLAFVPDEPTSGLIFYPGAKVQPEAYAVLLTQCAERGILCVLVKPPLNLSILAADAAYGVQAQFPEVSTWLIGGHSMGGVAAADYAASHEGDFAGIVFLAAYPSSDLTGFDGVSLSIVGTDDKVLNRNAYSDAKAKLPADSSELPIEGGNHANFGNYGNQAGDGSAEIPREEQQEITADAIEQLAGAVA